MDTNRLDKFKYKKKFSLGCEFKGVYFGKFVIIYVLFCWITAQYLNRSGISISW